MRFLTLHQKIDEIYHLYFLDLIIKFQNNLLQYSKQLIPPIILLPDLRSRVFFISKLRQDFVSFFRFYWLLLFATFDLLSSLLTPVIQHEAFVARIIPANHSTTLIRFFAFFALSFVKFYRDIVLWLVRIMVLLRMLVKKTQLKAPKVPYYGHLLPFALNYLIPHFSILIIF